MINGFVRDHSIYEANDLARTTTGRATVRRLESRIGAEMILKQIDNSSVDNSSDLIDNPISMKRAVLYKHRNDP